MSIANISYTMLSGETCPQNQERVQIYYSSNGWQYIDRLLSPFSRVQCLWSLISFLAFNFFRQHWAFNSFLQFQILHWSYCTHAANLSTVVATVLVQSVSSTILFCILPILACFLFNLSMVLQWLFQTSKRKIEIFLDFLCREFILHMRSPN